MGRSHDIARGASTMYQTQTASDARYVNVTGDSMTGNLEVDGIIEIDKTGDHPALRFVEDGSNTRGYMGSGDWAINGLANDDFGISSSSTGDLVLGTAAGSERLRISSSGRVTTPHQPAANWGSSTDRTLPQNSSWVDVQLDAQNYDRGNNYNNSNYRFTAPVAGIYLVGFSGEFQCTSATTWTYLAPRINGSNTANLSSKGNYFADFTTPVATYYQHSQTWLLNLAANDYFVFSANGSGGTLKIKSNTELQFFATLLG